MHVLVAVDDSDPAREAFEYALATFPDAEITALHAIDPYDVQSRTVGDTDAGPDAVVESAEREAEALFDELRAAAADRDRAVTTETVVGKPAREIVAYAEAEPIDHVVVGSQGRTGLARALLGSVAESVARRSPVPVTIVR